MVSVFKRVLVGRPLASHQESEQRLSKAIALPIFSADAIASSAFATQEILHVLVPVAGIAAVGYLVPISGVVILLLTVVVLSYIQTIYSYPGGGGSYVVSRENLGVNASLVAAASLLVDYVLTVAVSIAAGTDAILSAVEPLRGHRVEVCLVLVGLLVIANLRGLKESGPVFAVPTYLYIVAMGALIVYGLARSFWGDLGPIPVDEAALNEATDDGALLGVVTPFLLARAFSSGAIALSGVEVIANGVQAFKPPEPKNAAITLVWTGLILGALFSGVALLTERFDPTLSEDETILSQIGAHVFGGGSVPYYVLQAAIAIILVYSANTAFAGFPRLASIIAEDGFFPRQLANRGDRLAYSNGIILLALAAIALLVVFGGVTTLLVPLFAVGLFLSFTLSQAGMVRHHFDEREQGWRWKSVVNLLGTVATFVVLIVVVASKFTSGAWIPVLLIPLLVVLFKAIDRHYRRFNAALALSPATPLPDVHHTVVVLVGRLHRGVPPAIAYAKSLGPRHLAAVTVPGDDEHRNEIRRELWESCDFGIPLEEVPSPYRDITGTIVDYLDELDERWHDDVITVVVPEFVVQRWWQQLLHNQSALALKLRLLFRPNTVVVSVPFHLGEHFERLDRLPAVDAADVVEDEAEVEEAAP